MARRKGRSLTQRDVVKAALVCLREWGEEGLGVKYVAQQLGIKPPSLYNHVQGYEQLRHLVVIEGWKKATRHMRHFLAKKLAGEEIELAEAICEFVRKYPTLFRVMASVSLVEEAELTKAIQEYNQVLLRWLVGEQELEESDKQRMLLVIRASTQGFCTMPFLAEEKESREDAFAWTLQVLQEALHASLSLSAPKSGTRFVLPYHPPLHQPTTFQAHHEDDEEGDPTAGRAKSGEVQR